MQTQLSERQEDKGYYKPILKESWRQRRSIIATSSNRHHDLPITALDTPSEPILLPGPGMTVDASTHPKRRGRPPRGTNQSPRIKALAGASSCKCNLAAAHASPSRLTAAPNVQKQRTVGSVVASTSNGRPTMKLIPASVKAKSDFHTQGSPLP